MTGLDRSSTLVLGVSVLMLFSSISITTAYALSCVGERYEQAPLTLQKVEIEGEAVKDLNAWMQNDTHTYKTFVRGRRDFDAIRKQGTSRELACMEVRATEKKQNVGFDIAQRRCFELLVKE